MSKVTRINKENYLYFEGLLGDSFLNRKKDDMFVGLIDDEENAVSAAIFGVFQDGFTLRFIATDPDKTNMGYATELIKKTLESMKDSTFDFCQAVLFGELEAEELAVQKILEKNDFICEDLPVYRSIYKLGDFSKLKSKSLEPGVVVKPASKLSSAEYYDLLEMGKKYSDTAVYIDAEGFANDKYCICAVKNGQIQALAHGREVDKEIFVDTVIAEGQNLLYLPILFQRMYEAVSEAFPEETTVYIDAAGEKLLEYQIKLVGLEPREKLSASRFVKKL